MRFIAIDSETHLIAPGCVAPKLVCVTTSEQGQGSGIFNDTDGMSVFRELVTDKNVTLIGHYIVFDLCVFAAEDIEVLPLIFQAIDEGRIRCTKLRQMIMDNTEGKLKFEFNEETGEFKKQAFSLAHLVQKHLGRDIRKYKKGTDAWRMRYNELDGIPVSEWPKEAVDYAVGDADDTRLIFEAQEDYCQPYGLPGGLESEIGQMQAAWALYLTGAWGVRTNPEAVAALKAEVTHDYKEQIARAEKWGFVRAKGTQDTKKTRAVVAEWYSTRSRVVAYTPGGKSGKPQISINREQLTGVECPCGKPFSTCPCDDDPATDGEHRGLWAVAETVRLRKLLSTYIRALERGVTVPLNPSYNSIIETYRTSCSQGMKIDGIPQGCNVQNPPRKSGVRECFRPREVLDQGRWRLGIFAFCDYDTLEMRTLAQKCIELFGYSDIAEAIKAGRDLHLSIAAELMGISYEEAERRLEAGDGETVDNRQFCFHPDTEILTPTGWKLIANLVVGETVAAAIPANDTTCRIEWQPAQALSRREAPELIHLKSEGIDLRVTPEHRMLGFRSDGRAFETTPEELSKARHCCNAGVAPDGSWEPDEKLLRLAIATRTYGSYSGYQIRFGFTKQRKIERMRDLLKGVPHREGISSQGVTAFTVFGDPNPPQGPKTSPGVAGSIAALLTGKKFDTRWLSLSQKSRQIVLEEAQHWGAKAPKKGEYTYLSADKGDTEILQIIATQEGRKTRLAPDLGCWKLTVWQTHRSLGQRIQATKLEHNAEVVCVSVPSTFVLVRDGGVPVIVGNCKIANYGFAGGMAAKTFVDYAKGFGLIITLQQAKTLHAAFRRTWSEMPKYFQYVSSLLGDGGRAERVVLAGGLIRGDVSYTAVANGFFQNLAAMGAKDALYCVVRECYIVRNSALYGCRPWLFAHDEIGMEIPYSGKRASDAALRLQTVMIERMGHWCPDVPIGATACMARQWYKGAKAIFENGIMVPSKPDGKKWIADHG